MRCGAWGLCRQEACTLVLLVEPSSLNLGSHGGMRSRRPGAILLHLLSEHTPTNVCSFDSTHQELSIDVLYVAKLVDEQDLV